MRAGTGGPTCPTNELRRDGRRKGPQHLQGFAAATAASTGMTKRSINRALARAEALGDATSEIVGTSLDKGVELDALVQLDPGIRSVLIRWAMDGRTVSARSAATVAEAARAAYPDWEVTS